MSVQVSSERDNSKLPFTVLRQDGCVELVVPRNGNYLPVPELVGGADLFSLILVPLWMMGYVIADAIFKFKVPPRAVFRISEDLLQMTFVTNDGKWKKIEYPRTSITEFRKNRYEPGIWVRISGVSMESHLTNLEDDLIESLCEEYWRISREYDGLAANENSSRETTDR